MAGLAILALASAAGRRGRRAPRQADGRRVQSPLPMVRGLQGLLGRLLVSPRGPDRPGDCPRRRDQAPWRRRGDVRRRGSEEAGAVDDRQHGDAQPRLPFRHGLRGCTFAIEGEASRGGPKIKLTGHGFFKDFTVKDGHIIENHGGHGEMSSEVSVRQVVWVAESGKTPAPRIRVPDQVRRPRARPARPSRPGTRSTASGSRAGTACTAPRAASPVESVLRLENIKVERPVKPHINVLPDSDTSATLPKDTGKESGTSGGEKGGRNRLAGRSWPVRLVLTGRPACDP